MAFEQLGGLEAIAIAQYFNYNSFSCLIFILIVMLKNSRGYKLVVSKDDDTSKNSNSDNTIASNDLEVSNQSIHTNPIPNSRLSP